MEVIWNLSDDLQIMREGGDDRWSYFALQSSNSVIPLGYDSVDHLRFKIIEVRKDLKKGRNYAFINFSEPHSSFEIKRLDSGYGVTITDFDGQIVFNIVCDGIFS